MICEKNHEYTKTHKTGGCPVCFNNERYLEYSKKYKEKVLLKKAKHRAKQKGLEFNIDISDIIIPEICPVLGIPIHKNSDEKTYTQNSPSLDRIDNNKGYIKGNVMVISYRANHLKNNSNLEEMKKFSFLNKASNKNCCFIFILK